MDARIRDLQRAASMGDTHAREALWWEAYRLGTFGPGRMIGGARESTVDPSAGFRYVLRGMAFLGDVAAKRALAQSNAEYLAFAETVLDPRVGPAHVDKVPTKLTHELLTFSFGTIGTSALMCALMRYALEKWGPTIAADRSWSNRGSSMQAVFDRVEFVEVAVMAAIQRLQIDDQEAGRSWGGVAARSVMARGPGFSRPPELPGRIGTSNEARLLLRVAEVLGETGIMATSWHNAEAPVVGLWADVADYEARRRAGAFPPRGVVVAVNRELKAFVLKRLAPLMSLGIVP